MENETIDEQQFQTPQEAVAKPAEATRSDAASSQSDPFRHLIVGGVLILIFINVVFLYITNSRINDLETRVGLIAADSKSAKLAAAPRAGAPPDPNQNYTVNMDGAPATGPESAPITIVEASDFQCPYCAKVKPTLDKVREVYKDNVRIVWKHLPLTAIHPDAMAAATASEAAKNQGKFWEFHDKLFSNQKRLAPDALRQYALELGLDMAKFDADMADPETKRRVTDDVAEINGLGVTGTPGFFINGRFLNGAQPFESFAGLINGELKKLNLPVPQ